MRSVGCSRAVTTRMASTSRNSGVSSFPTHVKILPGRREKNSTAAKNTQENAASSTVALTFSPSSGSMPTVKDVEAQRGMAKKGPMVRYRAQVKKMLYRGLTRPAISCRPLLRLMPCAATPRRGIPTPVISRPTMAGHTLRPAWLPRKMGKIRFPAPKNRPNSMVAMKNCWLKVSRLLCVFIIHSPNLIACQYNTIFGGRQEKSQTFVPDKRTNR